MTKAWFLLASALALACAPRADPAAEPAPDREQAGEGARMVPFEPVRTREAREAARRAAEDALVESLVLHRCTADRSWCAQLVREGEAWRLEIVDQTRPATVQRRVRYDLPDQSSGDPFYEIWPHLVREAGAPVMVGLLTSRRIGYSGGGELTTWLSLIRVTGSPTGVAVLQVPVEGSSLVRACFGEEDMRLRREACHDDYQFDGTLTLADQADGAGIPPPLVFTTRARTYPGRAFRLTDQEAAERERRQFARSDLVWAVDPQCSYRRTFTFDASRGHYVPDSALPDCRDFLQADADAASEP